MKILVVLKNKVIGVELNIIYIFEYIFKIIIINFEEIHFILVNYQTKPHTLFYLQKKIEKKTG